MSLVAQSIAADPDDSQSLAAGTVLSYELTTEPDPIRASPATGTVELANLVVVGSRQAADAIEARKLTVYLPTGTASAELALDLTGIAARTSLPGWTATSDPTGQRIVFAPPSGTATIQPGQGVTIQLDGIRINRQVGSAPVVLELEYRAGSTAWRTDTVTLGVGKFPPGFHLRNLVVTPLVVDNGGEATLTWEASEGATYKLLYDTAEIDVTNRRSYPLTDIRRTTIYYLRGIAQSGNNTVERTLNTMISVNRPDLEVGNLTVNGTMKLGTSFRRRLKDLPDGRTVTLTANNDGILILLSNGGEVYLNTSVISGVTVDYSKPQWTFPMNKGESITMTKQKVGPFQLWWAAMGAQPLEVPW
ncbi:hypothetical protein [Embleya sp. NBC_00896]|uniref:hypothetical protein n=1 Tax=Embleya sp. NBC_00896 TaxID=2975961 RepID=UPI002F90B068|nr:hypothetical protein OG928_44935 [Embleya sp. NBC_00896]